MIEKETKKIKDVNRLIKIYNSIYLDERIICKLRDYYAKSFLKKIRRESTSEEKKTDIKNIKVHALCAVDESYCQSVIKRNNILIPT